MVSPPVKGTIPKKSCRQQTGFEDATLQLLKSRGYRITRQRRLIVGKIAQLQGLFAATDLIESLQTEARDSIDQVTVYRILAVLLENGLVHQIPGTQSYAICNHTQCGHLVHLIYTCPTCTDTREAHLPEHLAAAMQKFLNRDHSQVKTAILQVVGSCSHCHGS